MPEGVAELTQNDAAMAERHQDFAQAEARIQERSKVDNFLETGRERYTHRPNDMQIVADLIDFIGAATDDVFDKREHNSKWKQEVKNLSNMREAVANSIVEGFDNHDKELVALRALLKKTEAQTSGPDSKMFKTFLDFLPQPATEDAVAVPTEEAAETAEHTQPQLGDYEYTPVQTNKALKELVAA